MRSWHSHDWRRAIFIAASACLVAMACTLNPQPLPPATPGAANDAAATDGNGDLSNDSGTPDSSIRTDGAPPATDAATDASDSAIDSATDADRDGGG